MENWPYNGKSLWHSLRPGQQWAAVVGVPIMVSMFRAYSWGVTFLFDNKPIEAIFLFAGFFVLPWVYVRGIGMVIAVFIEYFFYRK